MKNFSQNSVISALCGVASNWIVDEEAAAVVKRIFDLCISGKGPAQIANILKADNVLIAKAYYAKKKGKTLPDNPYNWEDSRQFSITPMKRL